MKQFISIGLFLWLLCCCALLPAQIYQGREADRHIPHADLVRMESYTKIPTYVRFSEQSKWQKSEFSYFSHSVLKLSQSHDFQPINQDTDQLGILHERYKQTYKGVAVEGSMLLIHSKNGKLLSFNGDVFENISITTNPQLTENQALEKAYSYIQARSYYSTSKGELAIIPLNGNYKQAEWHLTYKFNIYAEKPLSRRDIFIDAQNGAVIWEQNLLHSANSNGTAETKYSGTQAFITDSTATGFRLRKKGTPIGGDVNTYNVQMSTSYSSAVDFTDADNYWNNVNAQKDEAATDAHWAGIKTYDYYLSNHNRNSINGNGMAIISYVHYDTAYFNAFWNGQFATFGDGTGRPLTGIDIVGHEFTHGVTGFSAGLIYSNESGALNESFSDIFGAAIEFYAKPNSANWLVGECSPPPNGGIFSPALRNMANPNQMNNPDTYLGLNWYIGTADNGGVHTNSGVQNYWFYLVCEGDTGTNDIGNAFNVNGIGITDGAAIAYRNLTVYLTSVSDYADARFFSLVSAYDLFGTCSPQAEAVANAWYAVGIGSPYSPNVIADFEGDKYMFCEKPATVIFSNYSLNATSYSWDFGDGTTSTANAPTHTYNNYGDYNVKLIANGNACGLDTLVKTAYVSVQPNNPCEINMGANVSSAVWTHCSGYLFDSGGPTGNYQFDEDQTVTISPTNAYSVQLLFPFFQLASTDKLYVYDGASTSAPIIGIYGGLILPPTLNSTGGQITLRFVSDNTVNDSGFEIEWKCTVPNAIPAADFTANTFASCDGTIHFSDLSTQGGANWMWDFGDGTTSSLENPTHEYLANGTYNVALLVSNQFGTDAEVKNAYITVNRPTPPAGQDGFSCTSGNVTLAANGVGDLVWTNNLNQIVSTGSTFTTPYLTGNKDYWVSSYVWAASVYGGPAGNNIGNGNGSYAGNDTRYPIFDVLQPCYLRSIRVYAQSAGTRIFEYRDKFNNLLLSKSVFVPQGDSRVNLDFPLEVGNNAFIKIAAGSTVSLFANNSGASYPYNIGNFLTIKKNSANSANMYFYFYDWEVVDKPCISPTQKVTAYVGGSMPVADFNYNQLQSSVTFFNNSSNYNASIWEFGDGTTSTLAQPSHTYTVIGTYTALLRAINGGCVDSSTQIINITALSDIEDGNLAQNLHVYPNPGSESFTLSLSLDKAEEVQIEMLNIFGQSVLKTEKSFTNDVSKTFSLAGLANGMYEIQVKVGNRVMYKKYFVEK